MVAKNANIFELRNHTHVEETSAEFCLIAKTTGAAWRTVSLIYQIARPERDIFLRSFFLELSDIVSSHQIDALLHKSLIS